MLNLRVLSEQQAMQVRKQHAQPARCCVAALQLSCFITEANLRELACLNITKVAEATVTNGCMHTGLRVPTFHAASTADAAGLQPGERPHRLASR